MVSVAKGRIQNMDGWRLIFPNVTSILVNSPLAPFFNLRLKHNVSENIYNGHIKLPGKFYDYDEEGKDNLHIILSDSDEIIDHENITKALLPQHCFNQVYKVKGSHQLEIADEVAGI